MVASSNTTWVLKSNSWQAIGGVVAGLCARTLDHLLQGGVLVAAVLKRLGLPIRRCFLVVVACAAVASPRQTSAVNWVGLATSLLGGALVLGVVLGTVTIGRGREHS